MIENRVNGTRPPFTAGLADIAQHAFARHPEFLHDSHRNFVLRRALRKNTMRLEVSKRCVEQCRADFCRVALLPIFARHAQPEFTLALEGVGNTQNRLTDNDV